MTPPRVRLRTRLTITTLADAPARQPTRASSISAQLAWKALDVSGAVLSSPQPLSAPAAGPAHPARGSRFEPHLALQSP